MKKNIILFLSIVIFYSCEKHPDEVSVILTQKSALKVKVIDNEGKSVEGATILASNKNSYVINKTVSDKSGIGYLELLEGNYYCEIKLEKNGVSYQVKNKFQVIAGEEKSVKMNVFENTGILNLSLIIVSGLKKSGLNVALVPVFLKKYTTVDEIEAFAHFIGKTDNTNVVRFKDVPIEQYTIYVYDDSNYIYFISSPIIYVNKGEQNKSKIIEDFRKSQS